MPDKSDRSAAVNQTSGDVLCCDVLLCTVQLCSLLNLASYRRRRQTRKEQAKMSKHAQKNKCPLWLCNINKRNETMHWRKKNAKFRVFLSVGLDNDLDSVHSEAHHVWQLFLLHSNSTTQWNASVILMLIWVDAGCPVTGTKCHDVVGVSMNGIYCAVLF